MSSTASLSDLIVHRRLAPEPAPLPAGFDIDYELELAPPTAAPADVEVPPASAWRDDLRFFVTCYLVGLIVFFVMLS